MASNSGPPSASETNGLLIEQFCLVTGSSRDIAHKALQVCNWNLERAINKHVDSNFLDNDVNQKSDPVNAVHDDEVRAPIPPTRDILVEDDSTFQYGLRSRKRRHHSVFDGSGDFQQLYGESGESSRKRRALEHIYRPPYDLMYRGNFMSARDCGQSSNRWLMVNVQNLQEFACLELNRDLWSDPAVKSLIREHFVFWQVYTHSIDGQRYLQFYRPLEFPHVAVIDPRTGEKLAVWNKLEASTIHGLVDGFLKEYSLPGTNEDISSSSSDCSSVMDLREDGQLVDLTEGNLEYDTDYEYDSYLSSSEINSDTTDVEGNPGGTSDTTDVGGNPESNGKTEENWKGYLGSEGDLITELVLRLPDGKREQIKWPCTTKIKALLLYIDELGYDSEEYELITDFPKRNLSRSDLSQTLEEVNLFPRELIIVQEK